MLLHVGQNEYGLPDARSQPRYNLFEDFTVGLGDIVGRTLPGSFIEHTFIIDYLGIIHSAGPGAVFERDRLQKVLVPGSRMRIINPSHSWEETRRRLARAEQIIGVPWWNMNCHQTMEFIVGARNPWLT